MSNNRKIKYLEKNLLSDSEKNKLTGPRLKNHALLLIKRYGPRSALTLFAAALITLQSCNITIKKEQTIVKQAQTTISTSKSLTQPKIEEVADAVDTVFNHAAHEINHTINDSLKTKNADTVQQAEKEIKAYEKASHQIKFEPGVVHAHSLEHEIMTSFQESKRNTPDWSEKKYFRKLSKFIRKSGFDKVLDAVKKRYRPSSGQAAWKRGKIEYEGVDYAIYVLRTTHRETSSRYVKSLAQDAYNYNFKYKPEYVGSVYRNENGDVWYHIVQYRQVRHMNDFEWFF